MSEDLPVIETSLAEDIEYYRHFYNFAPIGFYITKVEDGEFVLANPACIKMLGFKTFEELKSKIVDAVRLFFKDEDTTSLGFGPTPSILTSFELPTNLYGSNA